MNSAEEHGERDRPRVAIVGSGFGGLFAAKALRRAPVDVTLISKTTHHVFQPLLYQVATGILSQGEIAPTTRDILKRQRNVEVLLGEVTGIDVENRALQSRMGPILTNTDYDYLIVATGAGPSYFGHPEFEEFAPGLKTIDDALELRGRIYGAFEVAELQAAAGLADPWLTFVVVGAGPTGVEVAGQIRELAARSLRHNFRRISPADAKVVLIDGGDAVLSSFGPEQSAHTKTQLEKMGIDVRLGAFVDGMDADSVSVRYSDGRQERIEAKCKVWAAGVAASPLAAELAHATGAEIDRSGRIKCEPDLTLPGHPEIFVLGDMVALNDYPGVAQVAMQGAKYAAKRIRAEQAGKDTDPEPFRYFDKGSMATISRFRAVTNIGRFRLRGFIAWLMWLFVHLMYLVGFFQRVSTLGHWFLAFIGRSRTEATTTTYQARGVRELRQLPADELGSIGVGLDPPSPPDTSSPEPAATPTETPAKSPTESPTNHP
jgi:NADH dehydrogenase